MAITVITAHKKTTLAIITILIIVIIGSAFAVYHFFSPQNTGEGPTGEAEPGESATGEGEEGGASPSPSPTEEPAKPTESESNQTGAVSQNVTVTTQNITVTIIDVQGVSVNISLPVNRIVTLTNGVTEIIYALGCGDKVVGRDSYSTFPNSVLTVTVVYDSTLNMERLVELRPDLVIADVRINNELRGRIEELGIPVIIDNPSQSDRVVPIIRYLGIILGKEDTADKLIAFVNNINNLVKKRTENLNDSEKPLVYYEWNRAWFSVNSKGLPHKMITDAGGLNLAANQTATYPTLSPEYVLECNPDVIVRIITSTNHNLTDFQIMRQELMTRTELAETTAVKKGAVYVTDGFLRTGIRNPIGLLTLAKWFHPDLFADVDPTAIHKEMIKTFFGVDLEGTYAYP